LRGSLSVVPQFLAVGRRATATNRELQLRRQLLAEAEAAQQAAEPAQVGR
jgi:hypothetical protein